MTVEDEGWGQVREGGEDKSLEGGGGVVPCEDEQEGCPEIGVAQKQLPPLPLREGMQRHATVAPVVYTGVVSEHSKGAHVQDFMQGSKIDSSSL